MIINQISNNSHETSSPLMPNLDLINRFIQMHKIDLIWLSINFNYTFIISHSTIISSQYNNVVLTYNTQVYNPHMYIQRYKHEYHNFWRFTLIRIYASIKVEYNVYFEYWLDTQIYLIKSYENAFDFMHILNSLWPHKIW